MTTCYGCAGLINNRCTLSIPIIIKKAEGRRTISPTKPCPRPTTEIQLEEMREIYN